MSQLKINLEDCERSWHQRLPTFVEAERAAKQMQHDFVAFILMTTATFIVVTLLGGRPGHANL